MSVQQISVAYTAVAPPRTGATAGWPPTTASSTSSVNPPKEMGGSGAGTNPEQLFAAGYSACFQGALGVVARAAKADISGSTVTAQVGIGKTEAGGFGLEVELVTAIPNVDRATARSSSPRPTRSARTPTPPRQHQGDPHRRLTPPHRRRPTRPAHAVRVGGKVPHG
ncbi:hypothetical protein Sgou_51280 [Streptomyces gougerotii]|uniref:Organic hydroperoxide resistance protein n=1 Tax=Streptomyces gougerotii TaxID=53448 RepID=A0ABQ1DDF6_9ACTN|nr:hypothetical protein Sgou_51280 [Streptomyces gougerotii]